MAKQLRGDEPFEPGCTSDVRHRRGHRPGHNPRAKTSKLRLRLGHTRITGRVDRVDVGSAASLQRPGPRRAARSVLRCQLRAFRTSHRPLRACACGDQRR